MASSILRALFVVEVSSGSVAGHVRCASGLRRCAAGHERDGVQLNAVKVDRVDQRVGTDTVTKPKNERGTPSNVLRSLGGWRRCLGGLQADDDVLVGGAVAQRLGAPDGNQHIRL